MHMLHLDFENPLSLSDEDIEKQEYPVSKDLLLDKLIHLRPVELAVVAKMFKSWDYAGVDTVDDITEYLPRMDQERQVAVRAFLHTVLLK